MATMTVIEAVRSALREEMARDERVIVLGEDVGRKGGVFKATEGLLAEFGEERVIDTPLAESNIVGTAIGAAINGLLPVAEIQFADFIFPAMDQIVNEAARIRYRSNGGYGCPIVIRTPYGGGVHGALYHSQSVEAFFSHVPGLKVVAPATPADTKGLLKAAIRDPDPVLFFEHKATYRRVRGEVPDSTDVVVPLGSARIARPGRTLTVLAYGLMVHHALQAAEAVAPEGIDVEVIDLRCLRPLDTATVLRSVKKTSKVLIVHEDNKTGGFGAELAALIAEVPAMPFAPPLEAEFMLDPEKIAAAIRKLAAY
jgi:2-oxoisovalerate dehydrogenase E1 component beta subunit